MLAIRCSLIVIVFFCVVMIMPASALAVTFGLTPSVFEEQLASEDRVSRFVEIVRANPDEDTYLLVSVRNDPTEAIILVSGKRILLPLGQESVKYEFGIDVSRIKPTDVLDAGIEFLSEQTQERADGGAQVRFGGVIKVGVTVLQDGIIAERGAGDTGSLSSSFNKGKWIGDIFTFVRSPGVSLLALSAVAAFLCFALWKRGRHERLEGAVFLVCSVVFTALIFSWGLFGGRIGIFVWQNSGQKRIPLDNGSFFLLSSDISDDIFLNYPVGNSQIMEGDWRYIATARDRIFVVPATTEQRDLYENRIFRFHENLIQPYKSEDLPGLVMSARENAQGTYAVFSGKRDTDGTSFWCLANIWDKGAISCILLDKLIKEPIIFASFSSVQKQIAIIYTAKEKYVYDAWRNTIGHEKITVSDTNEPFEFPQPLTKGGTSSRWGFVWLDGKRIFTFSKRTYFPLFPSVWLESVDYESGRRVFVVDTRSLARVFLTDFSDHERLYWLQNGGFITNP